MQLTSKQRTQLQEDIPAGAVKSRSGGGGQLTYVDQFYVIDQLNQILGADGWSMETLRAQMLTEPQKNQKGNWQVYFQAHVRLTIGGVSRDGSAVGSGSGRSLADALHSAVGEAETDALKRAARLFGRRLGLAVYDKSQRHVSEKAREEQPPLEADLPAETVALVESISGDLADWWKEHKADVFALDDTSKMAVRNAVEHAARTRGMSREELRAVFH